MEVIPTKKSNYFVAGGVRFDVRFSFPRSRKGDALPCRGLITPQHPRRRAQNPKMRII